MAEFEEPAMDEGSCAVRRAIARHHSPAHVRQTVNLITRDYEQYGDQAHVIAREDYASEL